MSLDRKRFIIPDGITFIPDEAFKGCLELEEIVLPDSVTEIGNSAFSGCINLKSIKFPSKLKSIGVNAFRNCGSIKSIFIPSSLENIGDCAFSYMASLERIEVSPENPRYLTYDNLSLIDLQNECLVQYAIGSKNKSYSVLSIPSNKDISKHWQRGTGKIGELAFAGSKYLEELSIDNSILYLEQTAFDDCNNLKSLTIKFNPSADASGFIVTKGTEYEEWDNEGKNYYCHAISFPFENLYLEDGIESVETRGFSAFKKIKIIRLPKNGLVHFSHEAFKACQDLKELFIPSSMTQIMHDALPKNVMLTFENGLQIHSSDLHEFRQGLDGNGEKLYSFEDYYYVEIGDYIIKISKNDIKRIFTNTDGIYWKPIEIIKYLILLKLLNMDHPILKNGLYLNALEDYMPNIKFPTNPNGKTKFFDNFEKGIESLLALFSNSHGLKSDNSLASEFIRNFDDDMYKLVEVTNDKSIRTLLKLVKILGGFESDSQKRKQVLTYIHDRILCSNTEERLSSSDFHEIFKRLPDDNAYNIDLATFFIENYEMILKYAPNESKFYAVLFGNLLRDLSINPNLSIDDASALLIQSFEANMKRMFNLSEISESKDTAIENTKDLLKLAKVLGAFEEDTIIRQRGQTFINDRILTSDVEARRIIGDNIHRIFGDLRPREEFDFDFARVFMSNYDKFYDEELIHSGFICNAYNHFPEIAETHTSDKGLQRRLLVTIEKIYHYLATHKFNGVTEETEKLALFLGFWFSCDEAFQDAITIVKDAENSPRNIFNYSDSGDHDLREELNENYSFEWLPKQSFTNLLLGKYCNSCAHLSGAGFGIMRASMISPNHQNMAIKGANGKIIGKSTIYVNREQQYAVFNNVESSLEHRTDEDLEKIYKAFMRGAKAFFERYNDNNPDNPLLTITIGASRNTLNQLFDQYSELHPDNDILETPKYGAWSFHDGSNYDGDSGTRQRLVLKR